MNLFIIFSFISGSLFFSPPVFYAQAQTAVSSNVITGEVMNSAGRKYTKKILVQLVNTASGEYENRVSYASPLTNGAINFTGIKNGSYRLEIYFENDLLNPSFDPVPLYTRDIVAGGNTVNIGRITLPDVEKCPKDQMFNFIDGQGACTVISSRQPEFNATRIEDLAFSLVNYKRTRSRLPLFERSESLRNFLSKQTNRLINSQAISSVPGAVECDTNCSFNQDRTLPSKPQAGWVIAGTYDRVYKETGIPARYVTEYKLAQLIAKSVKHRSIRSFEYFEVSAEINRGRVYAYTGSMSDFTAAEKNEILNLVSGLVSPNDDERTKIRKIHTWITNNIAYDTRKNHFSHSAVWAYRNRAAVCDGYSQLLRYMLQQINIDAPIISGFAPRAHAWNSVVLENRVLYIDATWDAGYVNRRVFTKRPRENYFLVPEKCLALDHYVNKKDRIRYKTEYIEENRAYLQTHCPQLAQ